MEKERIFYYDILRAIAIIGIVSCHIAAGFISNNQINSLGWNLAVIFDCLRDFSIPIFVMLTGALLINKNYSALTFIKKRLNRVFVPYLFWLIIAILFSYIYITPKINFNQILAIAFGQSGTVGIIFWFVWMILIVYIAIFLINKIINIIKPKFDNFDSIFIKSLVCCFVLYILYVKFNNFDPNANKIIYYISFIGYSILGYYLANTDFTKGKIVEKLRFSNKSICIGTLILSIILYICHISNVINLSNKLGYFQSYSYFSIIIFLLAINVFLFFKYIEKSNISIYKSIKDNILGKLISSLSKSSYGIYLVHYMLIKFLYIKLLFSLRVNINALYLPLVLIITLVLSWIIIVILSKIPYLDKVSGAN